MPCTRTYRWLCPCNTLVRTANWVHASTAPKHTHTHAHTYTCAVTCRMAPTVWSSAGWCGPAARVQIRPSSASSDHVRCALCVCVCGRDLLHTAGGVRLPRVQGARAWTLLTSKLGTTGAWMGLNEYCGPPRLQVSIYSTNNKCCPSAFIS